MKILTLFLSCSIFISATAYAENDIPEGATLDIAPKPAIVNQTACKITCKDTRRVNVYVNQEGNDAVIYGCGNITTINCGEDNGR